jgi:hypothetical protein
LEFDYHYIYLRPILLYNDFIGRSIYGDLKIKGILQADRIENLR